MLRPRCERPRCLVAEQRDQSEHPGGLGVDDQLDFDRSVRHCASGQQPLKRPVVAQLLRIGWPRSLAVC
jgi:hypothetical protein